MYMSSKLEIGSPHVTTYSPSYIKRLKHTPCEKCGGPKTHNSRRGMCRKCYRKAGPGRQGGRTKEQQREAHRWMEFRRRLRRIGMEVKDYENLLQVQNSKCAICDQLARLVPDHCHSTNKPRGLLCLRCNLAIGSMEDNILLLQAAASYLLKWSSKTQLEPQT